MLTQWLLAAVVTEAVVELVKNVWEKGFTVSQVFALAFGQVVAWGGGLDFFAFVGVGGHAALHYLGVVVGGLVISRGANYVHDVWDRIGAVGGGRV